LARRSLLEQRPGTSLTTSLDLNVVEVVYAGYFAAQDLRRPFRARRPLQDVMEGRQGLLPAWHRLPRLPPGPA